MIGTVLLLIALGGLAWLAYMSIIIKEEEKQALWKKYTKTEEWLKKNSTRVEVTSAKKAWIEKQIKKDNK